MLHLFVCSVKNAAMLIGTAYPAVIRGRCVRAAFRYLCQNPLKYLFKLVCQYLILKQHKFIPL
jgi:hypothetical protein